MVAVLALLAFPRPGFAEFPLAVRASAGLGPGGARRSGLGGGSYAGALTGELVWRQRPGRAWVLAFEVGGIGCPCAYIPESARLESMDYRSLTLELERSRPKGSGVATFQRIGAGPARIEADGFPGLDAGGVRPGPFETSVDGFAIHGTLGVRLVGRPGPVGFILALRSNHVFARDHRLHGLLFSFGLTIHPLNRQSSSREVGSRP